MNVYDAITTRRSNRKFKPDALPNEILEKVIAAGRSAPTGSNSQTAHFLVIRNKTVLEDLARLVRDAFAAMEVSPGMYISLKGAINASKKGNFVFHYNTPTLIVTANKVGYDNAMADCACCIENMMIMANELDLATCYVNQLHWLDKNESVRTYMLNLGLAEDETICASIAVGFPDTADGKPNRTLRKTTGNPVSYVD